MATGKKGAVDLVEAEAALEALAGKTGDKEPELFALPVLDRKRPYGTVGGEAGARKYWQDGHYFDHLGNLVGE